MKFVKKILFIGLILTLTSSPILVVNSAADPSARSRDILHDTNIRKALQYPIEFIFPRPYDQYFIINIADKLKQIDNNINEFEVNFILSVLENKILKDKENKAAELYSFLKGKENYSFSNHGIYLNYDNEKKEDIVVGIQSNTDLNKKTNKGFCFYVKPKSKVNEDTRVRTYELTSKEEYNEKFDKQTFLKIFNTAKTNIDKKDLKEHIEKTIGYIGEILKGCSNNIKKTNQPQIDKETVRKALKEDFSLDFNELQNIKNIDKEIYEEIISKLESNNPNDNTIDKYVELKKQYNIKQEENLKQHNKEYKKEFDEFSKINNDANLDKILNIIKNINLEGFDFEEYTTKTDSSEEPFDSKLCYDVISLIKSPEEIKSKYQNKLKDINEIENKSEEELFKLAQKYCEEIIQKRIKYLEKLELKEKEKEVEEELKFLKENPTLTRDELKWKKLFIEMYKHNNIKKVKQYYMKFVKYAESDIEKNKV